MIAQNIKIDYHFHPNFRKSIKHKKKKSQKIRKKFLEKGINCVIITEHAYKNPQEAYKCISQYTPQNIFCIPGIECISKEGVDIIVFSMYDSIYDYKELKPFALPYSDIIDFVNSKDDLHCFITHPHIHSRTGIIRNLGFDTYRESVNKVLAVEVSNGAFDNIINFINKLNISHHLLEKLKYKLAHNSIIPSPSIPENIKFVAVGSDAHHISDIGNFLEIENTKTLQTSDIFDSITNNRGKGIIRNFSNQDFNLGLLLNMSLTVSHESLLKRFLYYSTHRG